MSWTQITSPNLNQTSEPYWCAYFVFQAFGGQNGWGFQTAADAWAGQANKHVGERPPAGVSVPVWFDWYGTLNGVNQNWGHVAISLPDGRVLSSPTEADRAKGQSIFNNIDHCAQAMGASYVGWSESMDGTTVVQRAALAGNQRQAGVYQVNRRAEPTTTQSALLEPPLEPGDIGNFDAWVYGETVKGNNVWFRGISGNWFWSGGFTDQGTHDLADLNPAPASNQRTVVAQGVNVRKEPKASGGLIRNMSSGTVVTPEGWVRGESITSGGVTSNIWYKLSDGYAWAEGFTVSDTSGLKDLNPVTPPTPEPEPTPEPGSHTPDVKTPTAADFPAWIRFDTRLDPDVTPTYNAELFEYYGMEYNPVESHIHWWGAKNSGATHDGTISHLLGTENLNVNFVVSDNRITLMVPMNQNAIATGRRNPYAWKTENDPNLSEQGYKTLGFLHYLVEKLNPTLAGEPIRLHKEFASTSCSELLPEKVREYADKFKNGILDIATGEPVVKPEPEPEPQPIPDYTELVKALQANTEAVNANTNLLKSIYRIGE